MSPIDHDRCSELLPRYLAGDLDRDETAAMEEHLAACQACTSERVGLEALQATPVVALTPEERGALERGVMAGIGSDETDTVVTPLQSRAPIGARIAQALGAAAVVAVIATFAFFSLSGGGDDGMTLQDEAGDIESAGRSSEGGGEGGSGSGRLGDNKSANKATEEIAADTASGSQPEAAADQGPAPPRPTFTVADDPYTSEELEKLGESSLASVTFAHYYSAGDAENRSTLLEQLVDAARRQAGAGVADQVENCGEQVLDSEEAIVPTFGAVGELGDRNAVILGFAWTTGRRSLDRYMVWGWERGDCDVALEYIEGRIETAD